MREQDQRKSLKAHKRAALSGMGLNDDFADDVADIIAAAEGATRSQGCAALYPRSPLHPVAARAAPGSCTNTNTVVMEAPGKRRARGRARGAAA